MRQPQQQSGEAVRQRVNLCLTKLSDRDTEPMAAAELDSIAVSLTAATMTPFLSALSDARPSDKTPLRRHPLRLLSLLSSHHPPSLLLPHLPRMLAAALRRLRDPDSSVRAALVDAVRDIAAAHPPSVPSALLPPLSDALLHEQDIAAQSAAALSLAAAISSSSTPDLRRSLQTLLPRLIKLLRSNAFKAKPAVLSLLSSAAAAGGASSPALIGMLVPALVDFLASDDWAARKAAAEALAQVAVSERDLLGGFKSTCLSTFESRKFDKVKIVRDSMNRMLEAWKEIPGPLQDDATAESQSNSSLRDSATASVSSSSVKSASPFVARKSRFSASRSPPPNPSPVPATRKNATNRTARPSRKPDKRRNSDWGVGVAVPHTPFADVQEESAPKDREQGGTKSIVRSKLEARRMLFDKNFEDKSSKLAGLKSSAQVVPLKDGSSESATGGSIATADLNGNQKDGELSTIRMQLVQIESQQTNMLDLLQKFIGSSQNGIQSLETRVHGLEMALNEISHDLSASSGRLSNKDSAANTCCRLPGADFLTSRFWRRTEGRYSPRFSITGSPDMAEMRGFPGKQGHDPYKWNNQRFGVQGGFVVNPLAEVNPPSRGSTVAMSNKMLNSATSDTGIRHAQNG